MGHDLYTCLLSVLLLRCIAAYNMLLVYDATGRREIDPSRALDPSQAIRAFQGDGLAHPELHTYAPPFSKWNERGPDIFYRVTDRNVSLFWSWAAQSSTILLTDFGSTHRRALKDFAGSMRRVDVIACQKKACLRFFYMLMKQNLLIYLHKSGQEALNGIHVKYLIETLKEECSLAIEKKQCFKSLDALPVSTISTYGVLIAYLLEGNLQYSSVAFVKTLGTRNPQSCGAFSSETITSWLDTGVASAMPASCLKELDLANVNALHLRLGKGSLAAYNGGLSDTLIKSMNQAQLTEFGQKLEPSSLPGQKLALNQLNNSAVGALPLKILLGRIYGEESSEPILGELWSSVNVKIFSDMSKNDAINALYRLDPSEIKYFRPALVQELATRFPFCCDILCPENITPSLKIHSELCFDAMSGPTQAKALAVAKAIPDQALDHLTADKLLQWHYETKNGREYEGIYVLNARSVELSNTQAIIEGLGHDPNGADPCAVLGELDDIFRVKPLVKYIKYSCFSKSGAKLPKTIEERSKYERLAFMMPWYQFSKLYDAAHWRNINQKQIGYLVSIEEFCENVEKDVFDLLPHNIYSVIDDNCLLELPFLKDLDKEQVEAIPASTFNKIAVNELPSRIFTYMRPAQLQALARDIHDPEYNNIGSKLRSSIVMGMDQFQIAIFTTAHWKACPEEAFAGIQTPEKLAAIPAEVTKDLSLAQVKKIPNSAWSGLTVDQAQNIGSGSNDVREIVKLIYMERGSRLNQNARKILSRRTLDMNIEQTQQDLTTIVMRILSLIFLLLLFFAALLIMYFVYRESQTRPNSAG